MAFPLTSTAPLLLRTQELSWEALEHLVVSLAVRTDQADEARPFGRGGQAQDGIDVVAFSASGAASVYQAKRYQKFGAVDLRKAVRRYADGSRPFGARRLVVVTTADVRDTQVDLELARLRVEYADLVLELWGQQQLSDMLFNQPDLVVRFFGEATMQIFCRPVAPQKPPVPVDGEASEAAQGVPPTQLSEAPTLPRGALSLRARVIGDLDPADALRLEVHPALESDPKTAGQPVLPPYVARPNGVDGELCREVSEARTGNRMVVLVGGSSNGKTRACWEAVRSQLPDWRIYHPLHPDRPTALLDVLRGDALQPHTVLWLNEAQAYLLDKKANEVASAVQDFLANDDRGPVLILGTMWPMFWEKFQGGRDIESDDELTSLLAGLVAQVTMPPEFSKGEIKSAEEVINSDPRLRLARKNADNRLLAQFLAGAPNLKRRYELSDAATQAVINAAIDARRSGHGRLLRKDFLKVAAEGYIDNQSWHALSEEWFTESLAELTAMHRQLPGPLTRHRPRRGDPPVEDELYFLADYLDEWGRKERSEVRPAHTLWAAAALHSHALDDLLALASEACRNGATDCEDLYVQADAAGLKDILPWFARRLIADRRFGKAEQLIESHCPTGTLYAELGGSLLATGMHVKGVQLVRKAFDMFGEASGVRRLAHHLIATGLHGAAERIYAWAAEGDDAIALRWMAQRRESLGDRAAAERYAVRALQLQYPDALRELAYRRSRAGMTGDVERLCAILAAGKQSGYLVASAEDVMKRGDYEMALALYRASSAAGDPKALEWMSWRYDGQGRHQKAEEYAHKAAATDDGHALHTLAHLRFAKGKNADAERLNHAAAQAGSLLATAWLHRHTTP